MVNYPYPTDFMGPLPAWPIKAACEAAVSVEASTPVIDGEVSHFNWDYIRRLQAGANVAYNYTGSEKCLSIKDEESNGALDGNGWEIQTCFEFPLPMGDDPATSPFTWQNWDEYAHTKLC